MTTSEIELKALMLASLDGDAASYRSLLEGLSRRLRAYYKSTAPLIGYYHAKGKLKSIDGMAEMDKVTAEIEKILGDL